MTLQGVLPVVLVDITGNVFRVIKPLTSQKESAVLTHKAHFRPVPAWAPGPIVP